MIDGVCCWECARTSGAEHNETCLVMRERKRCADVAFNEQVENFSATDEYYNRACLVIAALIMSGQ
jgi:hypothetical protein